MYKYGMRLRGFSIGCQPMNGFYERQEITNLYQQIRLIEFLMKEGE